MDSRSKKSRSLAIDDKSPPSSKRPVTGDRHNSAPAIKPRRESQSKRLSSGTKASDSSQRSSKTIQREDAVARPTSARVTERSRNGSQSKLLQTKDQEEVVTLGFAILGAQGVGKSYFARNAIDLRTLPDSPLNASKVSLAGNLYRVQLFELGFEDVDFSSGSRVIWPKTIKGIAVPSFQGVFCLYDVTDSSSVANVPPVLSALSKSDTPCMLVACKAEIPEERREVQSRFHEQVKRSFSSVVVAETNKDEPGTQKRCLSNMLHRVFAMARAGAKPETRDRSHSEATYLAKQSPSRDSSPAKSRSRSRSHSRLRVSKSKDYLINMSARPPIIESADEDSDEDSGDELELATFSKTKLKVDTNNVPRSQSRPTEPHTPVSDDDLTSSQLVSRSESSKTTVPETPESYYVKSMLRPVSTDTVDNRAFQTFLNMDEESLDDSPHPDVEASSKAMKALAVGAYPTGNETGVSFHDLVERLLTLPASKQDSKFVPSFLCLYRLFATPKQLLVAIIDRFVKTEKSDLVRFTKVAEMLRYLQVLGQWTAQYPGDFAPAQVRDIATAFVQSLEKSREFSPAAREINNNLATHVADDDQDWAYDDGPNSASSKGSFSTHKKTPTSSSTSIPSSMNEIGMKHSGRGEAPDTDDDDKQGSILSPSVSQVLRTGNSSQTLLNIAQLEEAREEAKRLRPNPCIRLTKVQWHQFMDMPTDEIAREITRIDWTMYSSIRPRDYVRHVTISEKRRSRRNDNISVMVRQFNHLALFVSGMILLRDKAKHRARAMEKFMSLAWKVRQMNNYNSLGAIVAGINGHEIARLAATRQLVPEETQKQFLRLTILMGISRSHAAYRMAWDNSFNERIPFIPLLRQDLTMASSANQTFIGANVNWKKFEIMGEAIVGVQRSLEQHYTFPHRTIRSEETVKLILESRILEESEDSADPRGELYDRSVQIEPQNQAGPDSRHKKFQWLGR
ncbi:uncharacterized protein HMPREF1541_08054 [Cyphellophora europaea CBS 101466]|uniref:Ras-GEF domain-containing protein n=1 Tax=Cyphellophora europaea (strain CBS 101466) TaxID=1220924 RepID=W2RMV8_CYPE1|nr:uncharacterized protein HMPREF1541_08054 [Cyphellophora europaea CBS 101466]ETN37064.1 hypothetical protein HMPREF1541_08054 [Cyphellophora europaea CBS 101466]